MKRWLVTIIITLGLLTGTFVQAQTNATLTPITPANAAQVTTLVVLGHGVGGKAVWSPDGKTLAVGSSLGVWLFDGSDLTATPHLLASQSQGITTLAFSSNSRWLAAADYAHTLLLWDVQTHQIVQQTSTYTS